MRTIIHVVDVSASTESLFTALTTVSGLAKWWTTKVSGDTGPGGRIDFTFAGDFNPVMQVVSASDAELQWRCIAGHDNWAENTFRFQVAGLDDGRTRLRFRQHYANELSDDDYGIYNFNWGYYLESLRLLCVTGTGKPFQPSHLPSTAGTHQS
jgi:uncharacterized protein YndB with AHSA1/START domain